MVNDYRRKLAIAFTEAKRLVPDQKSKAVVRLDDIMLASIRTLSFIWDANADKSLDFLVDQIIRYMAQILSQELDSDQEKIYLDILRKIH